MGVDREGVEAGAFHVPRVLPDKHVADEVGLGPFTSRQKRLLPSPIDTVYEAQTDSRFPPFVHVNFLINVEAFLLWMRILGCRSHIEF